VDSEDEREKEEVYMLGIIVLALSCQVEGMTEDCGNGDRMTGIRGRKPY
jgi:hypothetical protein